MTRPSRPPRANDPWSREFETRLLLGHIGKGLSSKAMALWALGLNPDLTDDHRFPAEPRDPSDLQRCLDTWKAAPFTLQPRMTPLMAFWIDVVSDRYPNPQGTPEQVARYYEDIELVQAAADKDAAMAGESRD
jgi:hypothetical protein